MKHLTIYAWCSAADLIFTIDIWGQQTKQLLVASIIVTSKNWTPPASPRAKSVETIEKNKNHDKDEIY